MRKKSMNKCKKLLEIQKVGMNQKVKVVGILEEIVKKHRILKM